MASADVGARRAWASVVHPADGSQNPRGSHAQAWAAALWVPAAIVIPAAVALEVVDMPRWIKSSVILAALVVGVVFGFREANRIDGTPSLEVFAQAAALLVLAGLAEEIDGVLPPAVRRFGPWLIGTLWLVVLGVPTYRRARERRRLLHTNRSDGP